MVKSSKPSRRPHTSKMLKSKARLNQELNAIDTLFKKANSIRKEREEIEASTKQGEQILRGYAEVENQKYKDEVAKLEREIHELRIKKDASIIAFLRQEAGKSLPRHVTETLDDDVAKVKRDRECAICLSKERRVLFLPCAHLVLCKDCNEMHEKKGFKDCPLCRSVVQDRICVRFAGNK